MLDAGRRIGLGGGCDGIADGRRVGTGGGAAAVDAGATLMLGSGVRLRFGGGGG
jgi:hypothetical protein